MDLLLHLHVTSSTEFNFFLSLLPRLSELKPVEHSSHLIMSESESRRGKNEGPCLKGSDKVLLVFILNLPFTRQIEIDINDR